MSDHESPIDRLAQLPVVTCPDCSYQYPLGTVVVNGELLDPVAESGGPPHNCPAGPTTARGLYQSTPATF